MLRFMGDLFKLIWWLITGFFRSRALLEAEIAALRHQLKVLRRKAPKRLVFSKFDRLIFASLYRLVPDVLNALVNRQTGDGYPLAPGRVSPVLAMEVALSSRQAKSAPRNPPVDPEYKPREYVL
jgi:hypothetical protein